MRAKYMLRGWLTAITIVSCLVACDSKENSTETSTEDDSSTYNLFWIPKEFKNKVFETGQAGAVQRAKELSEETGHEVLVNFTWPESALDVAGQEEYIRTAIIHDMDGIAISCNIKEGLEEAIDDAVSAGIPVMTFDSDSPASDRFTYLGIDNEKGGQMAARMLGESMTGSTRKKVAMISGVEGAANLDARVLGFQNTMLSEYPDLEMLDTVYCDDDGDLAAMEIEQLLTDDGDIGGFFFVGLWPFFSCDGTDCSESMPKWSDAAERGDIKTVSFDTLEMELPFVEEGLVTGLVGQKYWGWGYDAVQILYDKIALGKKYDDWTDSGLDLVCPNNYEEMAKMWREMDFSSQLSPCEINGSVIQ